ncbi:MAG: hypothetical protein ACTSW4_04055 [Candidatus Ranarchaeia archaeon]
MGEAKSVLLKGLPSAIAWAFIGFGISYIGFGIWNDLNWGAPWACPGPYFTATNPLECITSYTMTVEMPIGIVLLVIGIILFIVDKKYVQKS